MRISEGTTRWMGVEWEKRRGGGEDSKLQGDSGPGALRTKSSRVVRVIPHIRWRGGTVELAFDGIHIRKGMEGVDHGGV